jgi:hypothetical protein
VGSGASSHETVLYAYDSSDTSGIYDDALRTETVTYPGGRVVFHGYGDVGTSTNVHDRLHRVAQLRDSNSGGTLLTQYSYNGTSRLAATDYPVPDVIRRMFNVGGAGTNVYNGFDRFGTIAFTTRACTGSSNISRAR